MAGLIAPNWVSVWILRGVLGGAAPWSVAECPGSICVECVRCAVSPLRAGSELEHAGEAVYSISALVARAREFPPAAWLGRVCVSGKSGVAVWQGQKRQPVRPFHRKELLLEWGEQVFVHVVLFALVRSAHTRTRACACHLYVVFCRHRRGVNGCRHEVNAPCWLQ